jgi:hypothetical protein
MSRSDTSDAGVGSRPSTGHRPTWVVVSRRPCCRRDTRSGDVTELAVDLADLAAADMTYSGAALVSADIRRQTDGEAIAATTTEMLYFHPETQGLVAYHEDRLRGVHRQGDVNGVHSDGELSGAPDKNRDIVRIVAYEAPTPQDLEQFDAEKDDEQVELEEDEVADLGPSHVASEGASLPGTAGPELVAQTPGTASHYSYTLCVRAEVKTIDSGFTNSVGIKEDIWNNANPGVEYAAYGAHVDVGPNSYVAPFDGCVGGVLAYPGLVVVVIVSPNCTAPSHFAREDRRTRSARDRHREPESIPGTRCRQARSPPEAEALHRRALAQWTAKLDPNHPDLGLVYSNLGDVVLARGRAAEAAAHQERALSLFEPVFGADNPDLAFPLTGLGEARLALGDIEGAREALERAASLRKTEPLPLGELARMNFALARAIVAVDREHATALASSALDEVAATNEPKAEAIRAWLEAHRSPTG